VQALNLLGEPPWRPAAPKGFPDEDAAWIDGLAQRLDVANDASPARPIPNWRSKSSAVAPVDDIDWVNGNLVGYRRTVKKLIRGPIPYSGARIPCSVKKIPCSIC
jgi:hypothetical protein